jgi:hypothetical protein
MSQVGEITGTPDSTSIQCLKKFFDPARPSDSYKALQAECQPLRRIKQQLSCPNVVAGKDLRPIPILYQEVTSFPFTGIAQKWK